jgi:hypothetical protein
MCAVKNAVRRSIQVSFHGLIAGIAIQRPDVRKLIVTQGALLFVLFND